MRAARSGIVLGLALALLVPGSVVGQDASPSAEMSPTIASLASEAPTDTGIEASPAPRPPLRDIEAVIRGELSTADFGDVGADFLAYLEANPDVAAALTQTFPPSFGVDEPAPVLKDCAREMRKASSGGACLNGFGYLVAAYAVSRDDAAYDLLGPYVAATIPRIEGFRADYLNWLVAGVDGLRDARPDWFSDQPLPLVDDPPASTTEASEADASPPPALALKNVNDLLKSKGKPPKPAAVEKDIDKAYEAHPDAAEKFTLKGVQRALSDCRTGRGPDPREFANRTGTCQNLVVMLFETYRLTRYERFYEAASLAYMYSMDVLLKEFRKPIDRNLKTLFPLEVYP